MTQEYRYGSKTEATTYFSDFNIKASVEMGSLSEAEFNMYLLKATQLVDSYNFKGIKAETDQNLKWPRVFESGADPITPEYIHYATYETAYSLYKIENKTPDVLSSTESEKKKVKSQSLDTLRVEYFESNANEKTGTDFIPLIAKQYLKKYIKNKRSNRIDNYQVPVIKI